MEFELGFELEYEIRQGVKLKKIFGSKKLLVGLIVLAVIAIGLGVYQAIPKHNVFVKGPSMHYSRVGHTATLLQDGRVLIVGGVTVNNNPAYCDYAEIYNPKINKFELAGKLNTTREAHTATLLNDGNVFITGGQIGLGMNYLNYTEEYYYKTNEIKLLDNMLYKRTNHTATLLNDGNVLITGGETLIKNKSDPYSNSFPTKIAEIYDTKINNFKLIKKMNRARTGHTATLLNNGVVLIIGGDKEGTAEIYNPQTQNFQLIGKLNSPRYGHSAYLLKNGKVVIIGGNKENTVEIFNSEINKFELAGRLIEPKRSGFATVLLNDDSILIIGGTKPLSWGYVDLNSSEIYKPSVQKSYKGPNMRVARSNSTATGLLDGNVLVCGGTDVYFRHKNSCEVYKK